MFIVRCEDHQVRHPGTFATRQEAKTFAEWGHCCTARHTIEERCHCGYDLGVAPCPYHGRSRTVEAGNVYLGDVIALEADLVGTVERLDLVGEHDHMTITTAVGTMFCRFSTPITLIERPAR
jgi:hypothetical protein